MKNTKIFKFSLFILLTLALTVSATSMQMQEEKIVLFDSDILISENGEVEIHETIVVDCFNKAIQHGIYRDLPLYENSKAFFPKSLGLKVTDGKLDGVYAIAKEEKNAGNLRIYLGDSQNLIKNGTHTFELTYTYNSIIKFEDDGELLYLNITGNDWAFPILKCTAKISFPKTLLQNPDFSFLKKEAYTGYKGETRQNYEMTVQKNEAYQNLPVLLLETTAPMQINEGLTVYLKWKPFFFSNQSETPKKNVHYFLGKFSEIYSSNKSAVVLFLGSILILLYYFLTWTIVGKDPRKMKFPPSTAIFEKISPAAIRYIWKMGFDTQCLSTAIINMASKGYCTIDSSNEGVLVGKTGNEVSLSKEEEQVAKILFPNDSKSFSFCKNNYKTVQSLISTLKKSLSDNYKNIYFVTNSKYYLIGLVASIALFIISIILAVPGFEYVFMLIWLTIWTIGVIALLSATKGAWKTVKFNGITNALILTAFSTIFLVSDIFVFFFFVSKLQYKSMISNLVLALFLICINCIYFKLLKRPTKEGIGIYEEIESLRRFLLQMPEDLKKQSSDLNLQLEIDKLLPYALALDLQEDWFNDIFHPAANSQTYYYSDNHISWINSSKNANYSELRSFFSYLNSSISSSSTSSSSSGGSSGFSGGGSRGGGGGGW